MSPLTADSCPHPQPQATTHPLNLTDSPSPATSSRRGTVSVHVSAAFTSSPHPPAANYAAACGRSMLLPGERSTAWMHHACSQVHTRVAAARVGHYRESHHDTGLQTFVGTRSCSCFST